MVAIKKQLRHFFIVLKDKSQKGRTRLFRSKKVIAGIVQKGKEDIYETLPGELPDLKRWLHRQRLGHQGKLHLTFEVCGQAGCESHR